MAPYALHLREETRAYATSDDSKKAWRELVRNPEDERHLDILSDRLPEALGRAQRKRHQDERDGIDRLRRNLSTEVDIFARSIADLAGLPHEELYGRRGPKQKGPRDTQSRRR